MRQFLKEIPTSTLCYWHDFSFLRLSTLPLHTHSTPSNLIHVRGTFSALMCSMCIADGTYDVEWRLICHLLPVAMRLKPNKSFHLRRPPLFLLFGRPYAPPPPAEPLGALLVQQSAVVCENQDTSVPSPCMNWRKTCNLLHSLFTARRSFALIPFEVLATGEEEGQTWRGVGG